MMLLGSRISRTWLVILGSFVLVFFAYFTFFRHSVSLWHQPEPAQSLDQTSSNAVLEPHPKTTTLSAKLTYPSDYLDQPQDGEWCENFYSSRYLDYIASHHIPYCESGSRSSLECFRTHTSDSLCIARGVIVNHTRVEPQKATAMDCKLRNFTTESMKSHEAAAELQGVQNIADMHSYFFDTGVMEQLKWWDLNTSDASAENQVQCDAENNDHRWALIVKREGNLNIWHKLMELWQSMITLDVLQIAIDPSTQKPYLSPTDLADVQVVFEDDQVQTVDEWWSMLTGKEPLRKSQMEPSCLGNVILPLAGSSSPFWQSHWGDQDCHETFLLGALLRRLYRHMGIKPVEDDDNTETVVTIIDRKGETRKIFNLEKLVENSRKRWPSVKFQAVDFATLGLKEQVLLVRNTDVLIGVTGAAMTHILWLPVESSVAEIMTPELHYAGFRNLAKMRSLHYYTTHGENITANGETHDDWVLHGQGNDTKAAKEQHADAASAKRGWQSEEWLYLRDETFQTLVDAAIQGQLNKGYKIGDVLPIG